MNLNELREAVETLKFQLNGLLAVDVGKIEDLIRLAEDVIRGKYVKKSEVEKILIEADSMLSYLRHRGGIKWEKFDTTLAVQEVDDLIGRLRQAQAGKEIVK